VVTVARVELADKLSDARARVEAESVGDSPRGVPKFARMTRKEARVREDQYAALSTLARTLMRRRRVKDERITENTLIRVAIDLLLAHQDQLRGATEDELRESVTSTLPKLGTSGVTISATDRLPDLRSSELPVSARSARVDGAAPTAIPGASHPAGVWR
jgi:hypothetical protein